MASGARRVIADLSQGRNYDLYIVVAIAIAVALLGVLDVFNTTVIAAATLAVLAMISTAQLVARQRMDELQVVLDRLARDGERPPAHRYLTTRQPDLAAAVASARDVALIGVSLTRTVSDLLPALEDGLRAGMRLRVTLIDVESPAYGEAMTRSAKGASTDFYRHRIAATLDMVLRLATIGTPGQVEIGLLPFAPTFGLRIVNDDTVVLRVYQHLTSDPDPLLHLNAGRDGSYFAMAIAQREKLWSIARKVDLEQAIRTARESQ